VTRTLPPTPPELATRIIGDTAEHVRVPREELAARVATEIRDGDVTDPMIDGEEIAGAIFDGRWSADELIETYTRALQQVRADYMRHAELISTVLGDLQAEGRGSWIARALRHRFAFDVTWEALDRLGELTSFPEEALCATCGASLRGPNAEEDSS
jgi:hypothetical protein